MVVLHIGEKRAKISSVDKYFCCGSQLENEPKYLLCKRLLLGRYILLIVNFRVFKAVILPLVFCICVKCSMRLRDESV